jgi:hypothetical protein
MQQLFRIVVEQWQLLSDSYARMIMDTYYSTGIFYGTNEA